MESAIGRISALDETIATVVMESPVVCARCSAGKGCGAGIFVDSDRKREIRIRIPAGMSVREGDPIKLTIGPTFLLRAAMLAYGLPLIGMVSFAVLARTVTGSTGDGPGIVMAILGLAAGLGIGRRILGRASICEQFVPSIARVTDDEHG